MKSLQYQFMDSKGSPVEINGLNVVQMDRVKRQEGVISIRFINSNPERLQGVAIKLNTGGISLANGSQTRLLYVWDEENLPKIVEYFFECPDGELRIWNIYKVDHASGGNTGEYWTNNAGMVITVLGSNLRRYECSDGVGDFNPQDMVFEISWK